MADFVSLVTVYFGLTSKPFQQSFLSFVCKFHGDLMCDKP